MSSLGRQGEPLYEQLRTRGSVAGTEDLSAVAEYFRVTWRSVRRSIPRVVAEQRDEWRELDGLRVLGMDEFSYRKRHVVLDRGGGPSQRPGRLGGKGAQGENAAAVFPQALQSEREYFLAVSRHAFR